MVEKYIHVRNCITTLELFRYSRKVNRLLYSYLLRETNSSITSLTFQHYVRKLSVFQETKNEPSIRDADCLTHVEDD